MQFSVGQKIWLKTVQDDFIPLLIQHVEQKSDKTFLAIYSEMNLDFTFEKGTELFIDSDRINLWNSDIENTDYTGWTVLNADHEIVGTVEKQIAASTNKLISVKCEQKSILIPLNGGFITLFDKKNRQIKIEKLDDLNIE